MTVRFIPEHIADKIKETAILIDVAQDTLDLKRAGSSWVAECPHCGAQKGLTITPSKDLFKCFHCDEGGKGAVAFLIKILGKTYVEALAMLAERYAIDIQEGGPEGGIRRKKKEGTFRDQQLAESGITEEAQRYLLTVAESTQKEMDRYVSGTINKYGEIDYTGDDLVLVYIGLDGKPVTYKDQKGKTREYFRVRYANPSLHLDKNADPIRYRSPYGGGSHLWIPQFIIEAHKASRQLKTLYVIEGEKKADALCLASIPAVGIAGIHNFAYDNEMPGLFEQIIQACEVKNVVFLLDADWDDITSSASKPVDWRPRTFFTAVRKFRDYFRAYELSGTFVRIYFGHHLDKAYKGLDDLLTLKLTAEQKEVFWKDLDHALLDRQGHGEHVQLYDITSASDHQLKEFWKLHSRTAFFDAHRERLKSLRTFTYNRIQYEYNEDSQKIEMTQAIQPHEEYWKEEYVKGQARLEFDYVNIRTFLRSRGYGIMEMEGENIRYVHAPSSSRVVYESSPREVQKFLLDFTEEIERRDVLGLLLRGSNQYLGPDKLRHMYPLDLRFITPDADSQYLFFRSHYWKITRDHIEQRPLSELPAHVWSNRIIDFEAKLVKAPIVRVERNGNEWAIRQRESGPRCEFYEFILNTSCFHWQRLQEYDEQLGKYKTRENVRLNSKEISSWDAHIVSKMMATGYVLHEWRDWSNMRAIMCMDGLETEVGQSQGGTGKSIWSAMFEHLVPTYVIDGKSVKLTEDPHLYDGVDERTAVIVFDDCRVNLDFEYFFSQITRGLTVNPKGMKKFTIPPPKFVFNSNHAFNGQGNSFNRRQYILSFSDYYNDLRTPKDDFGHMLFTQWDFDQWNEFYNFIAVCIQTYLKHGLVATEEDEAIKRRKLRQSMGEAFLDWITGYFSGEDSKALNHRINLKNACEEFLREYPQQKRYVEPRRFKQKLREYAEYADLTFNPPAGERIKSNGQEYFILADKSYIAGLTQTIQKLEDL